MIPSSEDGFTLIELLIVVAIMLVITTAVGLTFLTGMRLTDQTNQRLQLSNDAEFASAYLVSDLQSMESNFSLSATPICGSGTAIMSLRRYVEESSASQVTATASVSYVLQGVSDQQKRLVRKYCNGAATTDTLIASYVSDIAPTVSCEPAPCSSTPNLVTITITDCARLPTNTCDPDQPDFTYQLKGARRDRA